MERANPLRTPLETVYADGWGSTLKGSMTLKSWQSCRWHFAFRGIARKITIYRRRLSVLNCGESCYFDALPQLELIVTVGKAAAGWHLPSLRSTSLTDIVRHGKIIGTPPVLPIPHPSWRNNAWLKGNPWFESDILPILRKEVSRLTA